MFITKDSTNRDLGPGTITRNIGNISERYKDNDLDNIL